VDHPDGPRDGLRKRLRITNSGVIGPIRRLAFFVIPVPSPAAPAMEPEPGDF
jgi:hypothetical protein